MSAILFIVALLTLVAITMTSLATPIKIVCGVVFGIAAVLYFLTILNEPIKVEKPSNLASTTEDEPQ